MKSLGIDIGTTTISAAVLEDGCFITSETCKNNSFLAPTLPGERIQDAQLILDTALRTADMLFARYPDIERIGVTGQMHGILYLDGEGNAVSPLYTWQDARGDAPCEKSTYGQSWTAYLNSETGLSAATGYGLVTHAYNLAHGLVPTGAVTLCTIGDYIAMKLCGRQTPVIDASNAAGLGFLTQKSARLTKRYCAASALTRRFCRVSRRIVLSASAAAGRVLPQRSGIIRRAFFRQFGIANTRCS